MTETMNEAIEAVGEALGESLSYRDRLELAFEDWYFDILWFLVAGAAAYGIGRGT